MLHDLLFVGEVLFALLGLCLIQVGGLSFNAVNFLKSKQDGKVLYDKFNATNDPAEKHRVCMEVLSLVGDFWRSSPATRWSILVGFGMLVSAAVCAYFR